MVLEVEPHVEGDVIAAYAEAGVRAQAIGSSSDHNGITITVGGGFAITGAVVLFPLCACVCARMRARAVSNFH